MVSRARYLMGTACEIEAWGGPEKRLQAGISAAFEEIARLERIMSTFLPESELSRANRAAADHPVSCSPELFEALSIAERVRRDTSGAFDVSYASVPAGHSFIRNPRPKRQNIRLNVPKQSIEFTHHGVTINLGGIGKGYALDRASTVLLTYGVRGARLNFGGQVVVVGRPPDQRAWPIAIAVPDGTRTWREVSVKEGSVSTSSNRERPHVVDPRNGRPAAWKGSVTVVAPTATLADAWSTALLVMGEEMGKRWASGHPEAQVMFQTFLNKEDMKK